MSLLTNPSEVKTWLKEHKVPLTKYDIRKWLEHYKVKNFTINDDLTVDVDGNVDLDQRHIAKIPFKFGKVNGHFACERNVLVSLEFAPMQAHGMYCHKNKLKSLEFAPSQLEYFDCSGNHLTSLEYAPKVKEFYCYNNPLLKSLDGLDIYGIDLLECDPSLMKTDLYKKWEMYRKLS